MEIKRQHIFKDILKGGSSVYHSAILTCYSFDPFFYSHFFRPQLNARGIVNQLVLIDAGRLDKTKEDERFASYRGSSAFEGYTPLRIESSGGGVFHPKIGLFIGEKRITAVIGSGNLTYSGMSFNDEAWCAFSISSDEAADAPVIFSVWQYLKGIIGRQRLSSADTQLGWMKDHSELLKQIDSKVYNRLTIESPEGERFEFSANSSESSIFSDIRSAVGTARVKDITICAPFYDKNGTALRNLLDAFNPERINCLVSLDEGSLPLSLPDTPEVHFYEFDVKDDDKIRTVHAKLIQLSTDQQTILAIGSANASIQALGSEHGYSNDEADIIIHSNSKRDYIKDLGIVRKKEIHSFDTHKVSSKSDEEMTVPRDVVIRSCELLDGGFHLDIYSKQSASDLTIHFINDYGKERSKNINIPGHITTTIGFEDPWVARTVFVTRDGVQISNRCTVIIDSEVKRNDPDRVFMSVEQLLDNATTAQGFQKLLQHVQVYEEFAPRSVAHASLNASSGKNVQEREAQVISDEAIRNKEFRRHVATAEQINDRILDKLAKWFISAGEDITFDEKAEDQVTDQKAISRGLKEDPDKAKGNKELTVFDEAKGYLKKLLDYYDKILWDREGCKVGKNGRNYSYALTKLPVKDRGDLAYSKVLIAVFEMCKIARRDSYAEWKEMIGFFISIVGSHLLIYRSTSTGISDLMARKLAQKHRNLIVFSLLLISFWDDMGPRMDLLRLLTLNLFDSYKNDLPGLKATIQEYRETLEKGLLPVQDKSVRMIEDCLARYLAFNSNRDSFRDTVSSGTKKAIVYKKDIGFIQLERIRAIQPVNGIKFVECTATAPGFPESMSLESASSRKRKIRGLIKKTNLQASSLVFETK